MVTKEKLTSLVHCMSEQPQYIFDWHLLIIIYTKLTIILTFYRACWANTNLEYLVNLCQVDFTSVFQLVDAHFLAIKQEQTEPHHLTSTNTPASSHLSHYSPVSWQVTQRWQIV